MKLIGIEEFEGKKNGEKFYKIYALTDKPNKKAKNSKGEFAYHNYSSGRGASFPLISERAFKKCIEDGCTIGSEVDFVWNPVEKELEIKSIK